MTQAPLPDAAHAVRLLAFLVTGNKSAAARLISEHIPVAESTVRGALVGVTRETAVERLARLVEPRRDEAPPTIEDLVAERSGARAAAELRRQVAELTDEVERLGNWRADLLALERAPVQAPPIVADPLRRGAMTWIIGLFDNHLGKKFGRDEVLGLQDYDVAIARARVRRTFQRAAALIEEKGAPVDRIVVVCGGDNVNGELRHDDTATNELPPMAQARAFAAEVNAGVEFLLGQFDDARVIVAHVPGNHGRTTPNPPSVNLGENYDCLAGMFVEGRWEGHERVTVSNTGQADAVFEIYGRAVMATHGDRIGANGGDGQIGAIGPTKRGSLKISAQHDDIITYRPDLPRLAAVMMGHFHTHWSDRFLFASGAGCGPDPWALVKLRAKARPPWQWLLGFDQRKGLVTEDTLFVGHPDEGPICADTGAG